jgi:hypothetical protein
VTRSHCSCCLGSGHCGVGANANSASRRAPPVVPPPAEYAAGVAAAVPGSAATAAVPGPPSAELAGGAVVVAGQSRAAPWHLPATFSEQWLGAVTGSPPHWHGPEPYLQTVQPCVGFSLQSCAGGLVVAGGALVVGGGALVVAGGALVVVPPPQRCL